MAVFATDVHPAQESELSIDHHGFHMIPGKPGVLYTAHGDPGVCLEIALNGQGRAVLLGRTAGLLAAGDDAAESVEKHAHIDALPGPAAQHLRDLQCDIVVVEYVGTDIHTLLGGSHCVDEAREKGLPVHQEAELTA